MPSYSSASRRDPSAMVCSTCGTRFLIDETNVPPFCSERCQLIDLGRWLDESIGVPFDGGAEDGSEQDQYHDAG